MWRRTLATESQLSAGFGQRSADSDQFWQVSAKSDRFHPRYADFDDNAGRFRRHYLTDSSPSCRFGPSLSRCWSQLVNFARLRPNVGRFRPSSAECRPASTKFSRAPPNSARCWSTFYRFRLFRGGGSAEVGPTSTTSGQGAGQGAASAGGKGRITTKRRRMAELERPAGQQGQAQPEGGDLDDPAQWQAKPQDGLCDQRAPRLGAQLGPGAGDAQAMAPRPDAFPRADQVIASGLQEACNHHTAAGLARDPSILG